MAKVNCPADLGQRALDGVPLYCKTELHSSTNSDDDKNAITLSKEQYDEIDKLRPFGLHCEPVRLGTPRTRTMHAAAWRTERCLDEDTSPLRSQGREELNDEVHV